MTLLADLAGAVLAAISIEAFPILDLLEGDETDRKQYLEFLAALPLRALAISVLTHSLFMLCSADEHEEQPVVYADRFINLLIDFLTSLDAMGSKPAAHAFCEEVRIRAVSEILVIAEQPDRL